MKTSATNGFVNQVLACTLATLVFTGSIGFGTVWLRHEISLAANRNRVLQGQLEEVQRRLDQQIAEVAAARTPDALIRMDESLRLGLDSPRQEQVEYVSVDVEQRLAAKRKTGVFLAEIQPLAPRRGGTR